ncbi:carotenoid biosynthesis protein [Paenibacillus sp. TRM 82003]|nr:carotenoid biosynthesis protein [Paenibacillus sp. TRM 82003]
MTARDAVQSFARPFVRAAERPAEHGLTALYLLWFAIGYLLVAFDALPPSLRWANAAYLVLAGLLAFQWLFRRLGARRAAVAAAGTGVISFAAEWFGVKTGLWFGDYVYGDAFAPLLFGVPLGIPFAWLAVLTAANAFQPFRGGSILLRAAGGATLAVAFDAALDPVAAASGYWTWLQSGTLSFYGVPASNFAGWWLTSFVILVVLGPLWRRADTPARTEEADAPMLLAVTLLLLFCTLALFHRMPMAAAVALLAWAPAIAAKLKRVRRKETTV